MYTAVSKSRKWRLLPVACLITAAISSANLMAAPKSAAACDEVPTGVATDNYFLKFKVPNGLMPETKFDGRDAQLEVHRVSPVYANGKCASVPSRAAVLVHGRQASGPLTFDLRHPTTGGGDLSVQEALARNGIDTFVPNLLGYGRSTGFKEGVDDFGNASLPKEEPGQPCPPEGCDVTHNPIFPLNQQKDLLMPNPLKEKYRAHSSSVRFARTDVWVRDIRQVIDDAITRAQPTDGKVALVGYSLGGQRVVRTLYAANPVLPGAADTIAKVSKLALVAPFPFGGPTEEPINPTPPFVSFPLYLQPLTIPLDTLPQQDCGTSTDYFIAGTKEQVSKQAMEQETLGRDWGGL